MRKRRSYNDLGGRRNSQSLYWSGEGRGALEPRGGWNVSSIRNCTYGKKRKADMAVMRKENSNTKGLKGFSEFRKKVIV